MFFLVSKLVDFFLTPSNLIALIGLLGLVTSIKSVRRGFPFLILAAILVATACWSPIGPTLLGILENRFPMPPIPGEVAGIVLLGGAVDTHITADRGAVALNEGGERITAVASLSRRYPRARIFLSGGASHILPTGTISESAAAKVLLIAVGVSESRIEMEEQSRNTCENAIGTKKSVNPEEGDQWILVTSANHMPRAMACFRAQGFDILPYAVDYRTRADIGPLDWTDSASEGLSAMDLAAHEWIGLATYRIFGLTSELFPAP